MAEAIQQLADGFWRIAGEFKVGGLVDLGVQLAVVYFSLGEFHLYIVQRRQFLQLLLVQ